jgi:hypothetical protein
MVGRPEVKRFLIGAAGVWVVALAWVLSPIDPLPDVVPLLGWLDDLAVLSAAGGLTAWWAQRALATPALAASTPAAPLAGGSSAYEPVPTHELRQW